MTARHWVLQNRIIVTENAQQLMITEDLESLKWIINHPFNSDPLGMLDQRAFFTGRCLARHAFELRPELREEEPSNDVHN